MADKEIMDMDFSDEDQLLILTDEEGKEHHTVVVDQFSVDEKNYVVLLPVNPEGCDDDCECSFCSGEEEAFLLKVIVNEQGEEEYVEPTEEEFAEAEEAYAALNEEEEIEE